MSNDLKKYVREQALKGVEPDELKKGLIMNGWDPKDVVLIVDDIYGIKKKISRVGIILVVLLVLVFSVSLLLIYKELSAPVVELPVKPPGSDVVINVPVSPCSNISDISLKDECYFELVSDGFVCDDLPSGELFYCNRALELFILESFN